MDHWILRLQNFGVKNIRFGVPMILFGVKNDFIWGQNWFYWDTNDFILNHWYPNKMKLKRFFLNIKHSIENFEKSTLFLWIITLREVGNGSNLVKYFSSMKKYFMKHILKDKVLCHFIILRIGMVIGPFYRKMNLSVFFSMEKSYDTFR